MALCPIVSWAQRKESVFLTVDISDVTELKVELEEESLKFSGKSKGNIYEFYLEFEDKIDKEKSKYSATRNVMFELVKQETKRWKRLTKDSKKLHWLKVDFDKYVDTDEEEGAGGFGDMGDMDFMSNMGGGMGGMPGMGGMGGMGGMDMSQLMSGMGGMGGMGGMDGMDGMGDEEDMDFDNMDDSESDGGLPDLEAPVDSLVSDAKTNGTDAGADVATAASDTNPGENSVPVAAV